MVFFGSGLYILPVIEILYKHFDLELVITTEKNKSDPVITLCAKENIPYRSVMTLKDQQIHTSLRATESSIAVLAHFRLMIPQSIIDIFPKGIINIHPSLLPKYRGATPGQTAILNGDKKTGISLMLLDAELDHGLILAQEEELLTRYDTQETFYTRAFIHGAHMLKQYLPDYLSRKLKPVEQNHTQATFTTKITKEDGYIDFQNPPIPEKLERMIRAYFPWPGVWTHIAIKNQESRIKLLPEDTIQIEGKRPMRYKDFCNGYREGKMILEKLGLRERL